MISRSIICRFCPFQKLLVIQLRLHKVGQVEAIFTEAVCGLLDSLFVVFWIVSTDSYIDRKAGFS